MDPSPPVALALMYGFEPQQRLYPDFVVGVSTVDVFEKAQSSIAKKMDLSPNQIKRNAENSFMDGTRVLAQTRLIADTELILTYLRRGLYSACDLDSKLSYLNWGVHMDRAEWIYNRGAERFAEWIRRERPTREMTWRQIADKVDTDGSVAAAIQYLDSHFEDNGFDEDLDDLAVEVVDSDTNKVKYNSAVTNLNLAVTFSVILKNDLLEERRAMRDYAVDFFRNWMRKGTFVAGTIRDPYTPAILVDDQCGLSAITPFFSAFSGDDLRRLGYPGWPEDVQAAVFVNLPRKLRKDLRPDLLAIKGALNRQAQRYEFRGGEDWMNRGYGRLSFKDAIKPAFIDFCNPTTNHF